MNSHMFQRATAGWMGSHVTPGGSPPTGTSVTVDFRTTTKRLDQWSVGSTISTYSGGGSANINLSNSWLTTLKALGPMSWRIPLRYNAGNPGSSAGGAQSSGDAATYVSNIRAMGGTPYVIMGGNSSDNGFTDSDASGLVHYFNDNNGAVAGGKVARWVIGNEPEDEGGSEVTTYISSLPGWISAMKGADSSILVSAPAAAYWGSSSISSAAGVSGVDILSYHAYDGGDIDGTGFPQTSQYYNNVISMQGMKSGIKYGVEEFNWHYDYNSLSDFYSWRNCCFTASVIGNVLSAGGHANHYSDSNGALGLLNDGSGASSQPGSFLTPLPGYWGIGMWTGMNGQFRRFGNNLVSTNWTSQPNSGGVPLVECYACDNYKILLINKDTNPYAINLGFGGVSGGNYAVWQTNQSAPTSAPTRVSLGTFSTSTISVTLPAGTVSSLELS
jgi:hypothetical protein